jgi:uncharacterized damage-inducible protein DinB
MTLAKMLLSEFDEEMANTRKMLEHLPEDRLEWRPHPKSMTLAGLATHVANVFRWTNLVMEKESLDLMPNGKPMERMQAGKSVAELLATLEENKKDARAVLCGMTDETLEAPWSLLMNGKTIFTMPKRQVLRSTIFNHLIHHRGQLSVYLRLLDVAVPGMYGPSADETGR